LFFAFIFALEAQVGFFDHISLEEVGGFSFHDDAAGLEDIGLISQLQGFFYILLCQKNGDSFLPVYPLDEEDRAFVEEKVTGDGFQNGTLSCPVGSRIRNNQVQAIPYPNGGFGMPDLGLWPLKKQCSSRISSSMIG